MASETTAQPVLVRACTLSELVDSEPLRVELDGVDLDVALVRVGDEVFAIEDRCSHGEVRLSEGDVEGCSIECFLHGSRFDLRTGQPSGLPAIRPVAVFPVVLDGDAVLVDTSGSSLSRT